VPPLDDILGQGIPRLVSKFPCPKDKPSEDCTGRYVVKFSSKIRKQEEKKKQKRTSIKLFFFLFLDCAAKGKIHSKSLIWDYGAWRKGSCRVRRECFVFFFFCFFFFVFLFFVFLHLVAVSKLLLSTF